LDVAGLPHEIADRRRTLEAEPLVRSGVAASIRETENRDPVIAE
jgi:hypothetical protein